MSVASNIYEYLFISGFCNSLGNVHGQGYWLTHLRRDFYHFTVSGSATELVSMFMSVLNKYIIF